MKLDSLVIAHQPWRGEYVPGPCTHRPSSQGFSMLFHPAQLGLAHLDKATLEADKKACKKIGPCGVGKKALYLNSFYIDRRYYLPYGSISRVFKRVAMSQGGFSGKGMFASMAYLVVEYDGGKQKQCNFKDERDVDALLEVLAKEQPNIPRLSAAGAVSYTHLDVYKRQGCPCGSGPCSRAVPARGGRRTAPDQCARGSRAGRGLSLIHI